MPKTSSQWLDKERRYEGQQPGKALVKWLNAPHVSPKWPNSPPLSPKFVEDLLRDAQIVCEWVAEYGSLDELNIARKQKKLPSEFWECHQRLNEKLATFTYAPQIDLHQFFYGERVSWTLATEESPIALLSVQVRCVLQLIEQGAILKVQRCQQCTKWFFARFSQQKFCTTKCRNKHLAESEKFKEKRRNYMRDYYRLQRSGKVK